MGHRSFQAFGIIVDVVGVFFIIIIHRGLALEVAHGDVHPPSSGVHTGSIIHVRRARLSLRRQAAPSLRFLQATSSPCALRVAEPDASREDAPRLSRR